MMPAKSGYGSAYAEDTLVTSLARTVSGNSAILADWGEANVMRAQLNATAAAGTTPVLDVVIEDTLDGTTWNTIATFTQKTSVSREVVNVTAPFSDRVRVRWTIGGTSPSFTFSVVAASSSPQG